MAAREETKDYLCDHDLVALDITIISNLKVILSPWLLLLFD